MKETDTFSGNYYHRARLVFLSAIALFFYRFMSNALVSQLGEPLFVQEQQEWAYKLVMASGFLQWLSSHPLPAALFDMALFLAPMVFLQTFKVAYARFYLILVLLYFFLFNTVAGHHYHSLAGLIVMLLPFCTTRPERSDNLWALARFYLLFVFSSAALWKLARGTAFFPMQLSNLLPAQHADLLLQAPQSLQGRWVQWLMENHQWSHFFLLLTVALQLSFLVGFFTRKWDRVLLALMVLFIIANYLTMGIVSAEMLILGWTLRDDKKA